MSLTQAAEIVKFLCSWKMPDALSLTNVDRGTLLSKRHLFIVHHFENRGGYRA